VQTRVAGVDEGERGVESRLSQSGKKLRDFFGRDDDGKGGAVLDLEITEDFPDRIKLEVFVIEGAQGDPGLVHGARGVVLLVAKEEEILPDLVRCDLVGIGLKMLCEQAEMGDVAIDGAGSPVHELDKVTEVIESLLERIFWIVFFA
jgi:hypothetical protein